ncbi:hypothetical protein JCM11641_000289 [Rhodosporidiobolus odoratus]
MSANPSAPATLEPSFPLQSPTNNSEPQLPSTIERLPPELIELIAKAVCRCTPVGPPQDLRHLFLLSKRFYDVLGQNAGFLASLFKERFDYAGIERRWAQMHRIQEKREKRALLDALPDFKPDDDLQLNPFSSFTRPSSPSSFLPDRDTSPWRPLTNKDYAAEFKRRCVVLTKIRKAAIGGAIPPTSSRPCSPRMQAFTPKNGRTKLSEPDELTQNLWTCFLMLTENDGRNLPHLLDYAHLRTYMRLFYDHSLLTEALRPGWPRQTAGRALGLWIGWLGGDDLSTETQKESDERFFVLKPYVFAAHRFDAFYAPWTIPSLPVTHEDYPVRPPPEGPFLADLRPRSQAQTITHMGRRIDLAPPNLAHAAIFSFFFRVEQEPIIQNSLLTHGAGTPAQHAHPALVAANAGLTQSSRPTKTTLPTLASHIHDRDFIRLASCIDPYSSLGLPKLYSRGQLTGSWEGRFSFFDFDSYRDMLGGHIRSLYDGPFGDQPQVWKLEERVVKLEAGEKVGGKGPALNAGFEVGARSIPAAMDDTRGSQWGQRMWVDDEEDEDVDPEGEYEILLGGTGHSAWGQFNLKGRVRAWDGMFTIVKQYTPDDRGRWVYRGFLVGGNLVGRWRDASTPIDMNGYEGTWSMSRRS